MYEATSVTEMKTTATATKVPGSAADTPNSIFSRYLVSAMPPTIPNITPTTAKAKQVLALSVTFLLATRPMFSQTPTVASPVSSLMDRPVVDATGQSASYDFSLKREEAPQDKSSTTRDRISSSTLAGLESQLGLKLESARASVDHVVIDHLEKPSEN